ncbi:MAG: hypothetical protein AAF824_14855 [Bacteroidota bacterium]
MLNIRNPFASLILLLSCTSTLLAQTTTKSGVNGFPRFKQTTMLVVLDNDAHSTYNQIVDKAIRKYWAITPFTFITQNELPMYEGKDEYSLFLKNDNTRTVKKVRQTYTIKNNNLGIYLNDFPTLQRYSASDAVAYIKLEDVNDYNAYLYKLEGLIQSLHTYLSSFLNNYEVSRDNLDDLEEEHFNARRTEIKQYLLYISANDLPPGIKDTEKLAKYYKHNFLIVSEGDIERAIAEQEEGVAYLHLHPRVKKIQVVTANGGEILYSTIPKEYGKFQIKDLTELYRKVGK